MKRKMVEYLALLLTFIDLANSHRRVQCWLVRQSRCLSLLNYSMLYNYTKYYFHLPVVYEAKYFLLTISPVKSYCNNLFFSYPTISYSAIFTCHIVAGYPIQISAIRVCVCVCVISRSLLTAINSNLGYLSSLLIQKTAFDITFTCLFNV